MIMIERQKNFGIPQCILFRESDKRKGREVGAVTITSLGEKVAIIFFVYVWQKHRRKGFGSMMIKYLMGEKPDGILDVEPEFHGYDLIATQWSASTPASRKMLLKLGFVKKEDRLEWSRLETASSTPLESSE